MVQPITYCPMLHRKMRTLFSDLEVSFLVKLCWLLNIGTDYIIRWRDFFCSIRALSYLYLLNSTGSSLIGYLCVLFSIFRFSELLDGNFIFCSYYAQAYPLCLSQICCHVFDNILSLLYMSNCTRKCR